MTADTLYRKCLLVCPRFLLFLPEQFGWVALTPLVKLIKRFVPVGTVFSRLKEKISESISENFNWQRKVG